MKTYERRIRSGRVLEIERYQAPNGSRAARGPKDKTSTPAQQKLNERKAIRHLQRLINANFTEADLFVTPTFRKTAGQEEPEREEARRMFANFLRRVRRYRRRHGMEDLRYIMVSESRGVRTHAHILMNRLELSELEKLWPHGRLDVSTIDYDFEFKWLTGYLTKEKKGNGGAQGETGLYGKRWNQSKNLIDPEKEAPPPREISPARVRHDPPEVTGAMRANGRYRNLKLVEMMTEYHEMTGEYRYYKLVDLSLEKPPEKRKRERRCRDGTSGV